MTTAATIGIAVHALEVMVDTYGEHPYVDLHFGGLDDDTFAEARQLLEDDHGEPDEHEVEPCENPECSCMVESVTWRGAVGVTLSRNVGAIPDRGPA